MNDEEREQYRKTARQLADQPHMAESAVWRFILDLDERIERLRNPLTPESRGE